MTDPSTDPGFAPSDLTDERSLGDWKTRYSDPNAKKEIRFEAIYLSAHMFGVIVVVFVLAVLERKGVLANSLSQSTDSNLAFGWEQILHGWLGGVLGGSIYTIKWLVHVVAKNLWNLDRRLWRVFTPHVSGALAFAFVVLIASGLIVIIDKDSLSSVWVCFGLGFLIGYFSDNAIGKLSEIARTLFGSSKLAQPTNDRQDARPIDK